MKTLGVLMLDTRFPRVLGDIGNPATFDFPVRCKTVHGASPQRVVRERDPALLQPFIDAGRALVAEGAQAITTSCGFLVLFQRELQAALPVPVWTSSLLLLPGLANAGVVTVDAASLGPDHLRAAGADAATPVEGITVGCALQQTLLQDRPELDLADAQLHVVGAAERLLARHPTLTDIVLECTNMPPYAAAVRHATGVRVHDITTFIGARMARIRGANAHIA
ncbi:MAG: aspartate/glutamate racemase family protein [Burkholderiaceae bacterium]